MAQIEVEQNEGVATITFARPDQKNAISMSMFDELGQLASQLGYDDSVRAIVLTGAGGHFSSGADLTPDGAAAPSRPTSAAAGSLRAIRDRINASILALHQLSKPTVAVVPGIAAGAGASLAIGCDLVYASEEARFSFIFVRRALALDCGATWILPRLVGLQKAKELTFLGDWISARDAESLGLVTRILPADELVDSARETALRLAKGPTVALSMIKHGLDVSHGMSFAEVLDLEARAQSICTATHDFAEGMKAFVERRDPDFSGG
mgnify:CR=1 FL=1